ncbi:LysR family transcriptional regulator [Mycobacterium sp. AMU20-3851]|uniref:LysR family transcriptional regulator n=1 Tax=Mycobacterium sp. AMU20-3851 TaxID=3122055 RepID=UPI0037545C0B
MTRPFPDLRRLRHFIAVAETGSFTGAANGLHLSQQALSSSVAQLEKELGATLFTRDGRRVALTHAGELLLDEGRTLLAAAYTVTDRVQRAAAGAEGEFVVGYAPTLSGTEAYVHLEPAIDAFPDRSFTFRQLFPDQLVREIIEGTVHLGLRRGIVPYADLATAVIGYDRVRLALPAEHRLATESVIDIGELAGETVALWAPPGASSYSDFLMGACRRAGFEPDYLVSRVQGSAPVAAPLTTGGVAFVTTPAGAAMNGRVQVVDLEPELLVGVQAMWLRHTSSAERDAVLAAGR